MDEQWDKVEKRTTEEDDTVASKKVQDRNRYTHRLDGELGEMEGGEEGGD